MVGTLVFGSRGHRFESHEWPFFKIPDLSACMNSVCHVGNPVGNDMAFFRLGGASMVGYYIVEDVK